MIARPALGAVVSRREDVAQLFGAPVADVEQKPTWRGSGPGASVADLVALAPRDLLPSFGDCGTRGYDVPDEERPSYGARGVRPGCLYDASVYACEWVAGDEGDGFEGWLIDPCVITRWHDDSVCGCGCDLLRDQCFFCHAWVSETEPASKGGGKMRAACHPCADARRGES